MTKVISPYYTKLGIISILPYTICIFGAISNFFLIIAFIKDPLKCFRNLGTYFIANLAVSDFLACFVSLFTCCVPTHWLLAFDLALPVTSIVSFLTIASISLDRFLMVAYPLKHRVMMKGKPVNIWLSFIWIAGFIYPMKECIPHMKTSLHAFIVNIVAGVIIALSCVIYGFTYHKLQKQSKNVALENLPNRQQQMRFIKEKQFLRTITLIACISFVCSIPTTTVYQYTVFKYGMVSRTLTGIVYGFFYFNFAVNPLVYVLRFPNYRKSFYQLYCCKAMTRN